MGSYNPDLENQLWALLSKLENGVPGFDMEGRGARPNPNLRWGFAMLAELRTLDLWRAVIGECLAVVFYVLLVCGAYSPWAGQPTPPERHLVISLVAGFAMTVLVHCFCQVSGGHVNPAVTIALAAMRRVSPLRALLLVLAQLGGGIAGAALLFGATSSGYSGDLGATVISRVITVGQGFGVEFLLSFVVVLAYFSAMCPHRRPSGGHPALIVGLAYLATTLVGLPLTGASMNPARSLGPAFVMNSWHAHWVYWAGPILGGLTAGFIHEFIFNPRRSPLSRNHSTDGGFEIEPSPQKTAAKKKNNHQQHQQHPNNLSPNDTNNIVQRSHQQHHHQQQQYPISLLQSVPPPPQYRQQNQENNRLSQQLYHIDFEQEHQLLQRQHQQPIPLALLQQEHLSHQHQRSAAAATAATTTTTTNPNTWPLDIGL